MINAASKLLLHLFLPGMDSELGVLSGSDAFAVSSLEVLDILPSYDSTRLELAMGTESGEHKITAWFFDFEDDVGPVVTRYAGTVPAALQHRAGLVLKKKLHVRAVVHERAVDAGTAVVERCAVIRMLGRGGISDPCIRICIPFSTLGLISADLASSPDEESLERAIIDYFCEPSRLFPDLGTMLDVLDNREIQDLLYRLQKNRLLSTYQICLIIAAFPGHSLRVRRCISANTANDVTEMMSSLKRNRSVTRRDLAGGIYSVEEAVYCLMMRGVDFGNAAFLREHRAMVASIADMETLMLFDFATWLKRMEDDALLYHVLAETGDRDVARALSGAGEIAVSIMERNMSSNKISEMLDLAKNPCTMDERIASRCRLVKTYRTLRVRKRNWGAESFEYLLRCVSHPRDFRRILMAAGWFAISTALKGAKPDSVKRMTDQLPAPARFLIEDVLRGVVNPNIIHDELQVDAARKRCVETMLLPVEDGAIALDS